MARRPATGWALPHNKQPVRGASMKDIEYKWHWDGTTWCGRRVWSAPLDMQEYDADGNLSKPDHRPVDCKRCLDWARLEVSKLCDAIVGQPEYFPSGHWSRALFEPWRGVQEWLEREGAVKR